MSAFLGPIHFWLYNKIQLQEGLIREIAGKAEEKSWMTDAASFVNPEDRPLEKLIDTGNIHGWLQERIHDCEGRYASLVTKLVQAEPGRLTEIKQAVFDFGKKQAMPTGTTASDAYKLLEDSLLNGMPCDHVNQVVTREENHVVWNRAQNLHAGYWETSGGDPEHYDLLADAFISGLLSETNLSYDRTAPDQFEIRITGEPA